MKKNELKVLWSVIVIFLLVVLLNNLRFIDHSNIVGASDKIDEGKTVFLTIKESSPKFKRKGFSELKDSLKLWEYDKENKYVYLREQSFIPSKNTPLLVIHDKGYDSYSNNQNIMPINTFPFSLGNTGTPVIVNGIDDDGAAKIVYRDKELSIKPNQTYREVFFDGYKIKIATIKNYGLYEQKQFKKLKKQ